MFAFLHRISPSLTITKYWYWGLLNGAVEVVAALRQTKEQGWGLLLVEGIVSVLAGVVAFAYPGIPRSSFSTCWPPGRW